MRALGRAVKAHATILFLLVALLWSLELFDLLVLGGRLDVLGIHPRDTSYLWGILLAPLLHGGLAHLIANTVPLVVLGWLVMLRRLSDFFVVTLIAAVVAGLGVWLFGAPRTIHIGASGVVFGYLGYLLLRGYFERSAVAILLALFVGVVYGSALWGVLPIRQGISWEGHLFGFLGGGGAARLLARPRGG